MKELADKLLHIEKQIAEIRQHTVELGTGPISVYAKLLDVGGTLLVAASKLRDAE